MKTLINLFAIVLISLSINLTSSATAFETTNSLPEVSIEASSSYYLKNFVINNAEFLALAAHPTTEYIGYRDVRVSGNSAAITLKMRTLFDNVIETRIKIYVNRNDYISRVSVVWDDSWFPAFGSLDLIKEILDEELRKSYDPNSSKTMKIVENVLNKSYYEWTGRDMVVFALNYSWIDDGYYAAF